MSKDIKDKAKENLKAQLSVIPTKEDKLPALPTWKPYQSERLKEEEIDTLFNGPNVKGLAIICGAVSGNLEVIDVDTKHDTTGTLWEELRVLIEDNLPELYTKLVIAQTKSGGYHIYYRCSTIAGNLKLSTKLNREVLVETRGEGGYVIAPPTPGYKYIQGDTDTIPTINPEDRDILFSIAKSFNELEEIKPKVNITPSTTYSSSGLTPWEDYNQRGDVLALLESKGWRVLNQTGQKINILRPGSTDSKTSGNYHTGLKVLRVFSSSTEFNPDKGYSPAQVFSLLECNEDSKLTYRRLLELGYGEPYKGDTIRPTQVKTDYIKVEVVNSVNRETLVISTPGDSLKIENIQTAIGEEVVITSPGIEAQEEILRAIDLLLQTGKRIYIKEEGTEIREYKYQLKAIFNKYATIQDESGAFTDRDRDNLLDEVLIISSKLQPVDKDVFLKDFTSLKAIKELGITDESLFVTADRLTSTRDKEAQAKKLNQLLKQANELHDKGETATVLNLLVEKGKDIKLTGAKDLLPPPMSFTTLLEDIASLPPAYKTGYSSLDKFIGFTPGAITLVAGRPSHGKTTFMFNLLLEMSRIYKDENFYFFTYEEPVRNISIKLLNRLVATDLSGYYGEIRDLSKPTNYEFLKSYIKNRRADIPEIEEGKRQLQDLVDSQRIKVIDKNYSVEELYSLISYCKNKERIGGVFIDYIQRMRTDRKTQDKRTEIAHISDQVLQIAKDTGLPLILGAQLNRATDTKGGKPKLENLKEAGNLEEDANTVISVYCRAREEEETESGEQSSKQREVELEIKTLKNREGEVNTTETLSWDRWNGVIKERSSNSGRSYYK
jgi:replicative DNA helicase